MLSYPLPNDVSLVPLEPHHAEPLFRVIDANRAHLRLWLPWVEATRSPDDVLGFIRRVVQQRAENNGVQCAVLVGGEIAGVLGQHRIDWQNRSTSLGYWLAETFQGRGLMSGCCRAYVEYSFGTLALNRVEIRAAVENHRSRAIAQRLGFTHEGVLRQAERLGDRYVDHAVYGLLRGEWTLQREPMHG
jgi:ribosomal-protein-serine acetyltransferase